MLFGRLRVVLEDGAAVKARRVRRITVAMLYWRLQAID